MAMVQEWHDGRTWEAERLCGNPSIWTIENCARVLKPCEGEDGDYTFDIDSVKVIHAKEKTFAPLFKKRHSRKNVYRTMKYCDWLRMNVAVTLMQILRPSQTTYMATWQVGLVERAVAGRHIHWACIL